MCIDVRDPIFKRDCDVEIPFTCLTTLYVCGACPMKILKIPCAGFNFRLDRLKPSASKI
jgi:hypothetical protein